jgi:hypothetical protein
MPFVTIKARRQNAVALPSRDRQVANLTGRHLTLDPQWKTLHDSV